jgi:hypothetical protein
MTSTGCRCEACTKAHADYKRVYMRLQMHRSKRDRPGRPMLKFGVSSESKNHVDLLMSLAFKRA